MEQRFRSLFGIERKKVAKNVLLLPFVPPGVLDALGVKTLHTSKLFASITTNDNLTVVRTGMSASFVGDAVLYLAGSPCENIIMLGSCGLVNKKLGLNIGSLVTPVTSFGLDSFSDIISGRMQSPVSVNPDNELLTDFIETTGITLHKSACVSFGSLAQEDIFVPVFQRLGADVIEMECAALFHAARKADKRAMAILFVADVLGEKPFYNELSLSDKKILKDNLHQAIKAIQLFSCQN